MPTGVIDQLHRMARRAKTAKGYRFTNRDNVDLDELYAQYDDDLDTSDDDDTIATAGVGNADTSDEEDSTYKSNNHDERSTSTSDSDSDDGGPENDFDAPEENDANNENNTTIIINNTQPPPTSNAVEDAADENIGHDNNEHNEDEGSYDARNEDEESSGNDDNMEVIDFQNDDVDAVLEAGHRISNEGLQTTGVADDDDNTSEHEEQQTTGVVANDDGVNEHREAVTAIDTQTTGVDPIITGVQHQAPEDTGRNQYSGMRLRSRNRAGVNPRRDYHKMAHGSDDEIVMLLQEEHRQEVMMLNIDVHASDEEFITEISLDDDDIEWIFLTEQMNWKQGLRRFKDKGEDAITKELKQVHDLEGFEPKHWNELSREERSRALRYLMYLKEKRCGKIKARGCADGRKQRIYTNKEETSSPTVSLAGLMLTCVIDAAEQRDVATVDIPGAFLQTEQPNDEDVHVMLEGRMAELLAKIHPPTYQEYVHQHRGQAQIYVRLKKALYGTLKAALLFWKKLSKSLVDDGFVINEYDWCVANKMVNGKQCTVVWHVDDLKISHADSRVVTNVIKMLKTQYGKVGELNVVRGKRHEYLGIDLDFSTPGKVIISMQQYIERILDELPADMKGTATSPAAEHLFQVREQPDGKLDPATADLFHHIVAQLLFICKRARPDIQTAISFLCTRVKSPDHDDYKKLTRVVRYLRRTKFLRLTLEAHGLDTVQWWVDGAFAVHNDMRSHTGSYMSMGKGMMNGGSTKHKINSTSSTEAELISVHDTMPAILWTQYFLQAQGYEVQPATIHQDNMSTMLLSNNGRGSSSKRTRHIKIRYFFITDRIKKNEVRVQYCPTDDMIGDFFTKPLNGAKFRKFRNIIMNCDYDETGPVHIGPEIAVSSDPAGPKTYRDAVTGSQECVGDIRAQTYTSGGKYVIQPRRTANDVEARIQLRDKSGPPVINHRMVNKNNNRAPVSAE